MIRKGECITKIHTLHDGVCTVLVIPQYEYSILDITQVQGKAEDTGNN